MYKGKIHSLLNTHVIDTNVSNIILEYSHPIFQGKHCRIDIDIDVHSCLHLNTTDSERFIIGTESGIIYVLKHLDGSQTDDMKEWICEHELNIHTSKVHILKSIKNDKLISVSNDGLICVWDLLTYECLTRVSVQFNHSKYDLIQTLEPLSNQYLLFTTIDNNFLNIFDVRNGCIVNRLHGHQKPVHSLLRLENNNIVSTSRSSTYFEIILWESVSDNELKILKIIKSTTEKYCETCVSHGLFPNSIMFPRNKMICLYISETEQSIPLFQEKYSVTSISYTLDGKIITVNENNEVFQWVLKKDAKWSCKKIHCPNDCIILKSISNGKILCLSEKGKLSILY